MSNFVCGAGGRPAEVLVAVVTYNSAGDVDALMDSLRSQADSTVMRVVCVDNSSGDDTVRRLRRHADVAVLEAGGNLGYAGGINVALNTALPGEHVLILNPDLRVGAGAIRALLDRMAEVQAGVVVPRIQAPDGTSVLSQRREPTVLRALGDALFGSRFRSRPGWLSDEVADPLLYEHAHPVEWGSGAALLVHRDAVRAVGPWDERFFLYSEEIDFQRRAREIGFSVWFEPAAVVMHRQGGSGSSRELVALMEVNRIRYRRKFSHSANVAGYHAAVALHQLLRSWQPERRYALRVVLNERSWGSLPSASHDRI